MRYNYETHVTLSVWGGAHDGEEVTIPRHALRRGAEVTVPRPTYRDHRTGAYVDDPVEKFVDVYRVVPHGALLYLEHVRVQAVPLDSRERSEV